MGNTTSNSNNNNNDDTSVASWKHGDFKPPFEFLFIICEEEPVDERRDDDGDQTVGTNTRFPHRLTNLLWDEKEDNDKEAFVERIPYASIPPLREDKDSDASTNVSPITDDLSAPYARLLPDDWYETQIIADGVDIIEQSSMSTISEPTLDEEIQVFEEEEEEEEEVDALASSASSVKSGSFHDDHRNKHIMSTPRRLEAPPGVTFCYEKYDHEHLKVPGLRPVGDLLIPRISPIAGFLNQKPSFIVPPPPKQLV